MQNKTTLSNFVQEEREKLNLSQAEFAKKYNIPSGTLASIESGYAKSPRSVTLKRLADIFKVPLSKLVNLASNSNDEGCAEIEANEYKKLPVYGEMPSKVFLKENIINCVTFPKSFIEDGDFLLSINSDDYEKEGIHKDDYLVISEKYKDAKESGIYLAHYNNNCVLVLVRNNNDSIEITNFQNKKINENVIIKGKIVTSIRRKSF